jgi:hypothetical protein
MCVVTDNRDATQNAGRRFFGTVTGLIGRIGGFIKNGQSMSGDLRGKNFPIAGSAGAAASQASPAAGPDGAAILDGGSITARSVDKGKTEFDADTGTRIKYVLKGACMAGFGFLLGNAPTVMGANPFGTALLCAAGRYAGFIYAGLLGSALFSDMRSCSSVFTALQ